MTRSRPDSPREHHPPLHNAAEPEAAEPVLPVPANGFHGHVPEYGEAGEVVIVLRANGFGGGPHAPDEPPHAPDEPPHARDDLGDILQGD